MHETGALFKSIVIHKESRFQSFTNYFFMEEVSKEVKDTNKKKMKLKLLRR